MRTTYKKGGGTWRALGSQSRKRRRDNSLLSQQTKTEEENSGRLAESKKK